jgi:hypothetical protein
VWVGLPCLAKTEQQGDCLHESVYMGLNFRLASMGWTQKNRMRNDANRVFGPRTKLLLLSRTGIPVLCTTY